MARRAGFQMTGRGMAPSPGAEVWRGGVNTWECDEMGHLNARFYVARAMEGLVGMAGLLGLGDAFRHQANATLIVEEHYLKFLKEARAGTPLHMTAGILEIDDTRARILQLLIHSATGELAAATQTVITHATTADHRVFPWSPRTLQRAEGLRVEAPTAAIPRSLEFAPASGAASLAEADRLGLVRLGLGAVSPAECDAFGRMRPEVFLGRISDGVPAMGAVFGVTSHLNPNSDLGLGAAVLETRAVYHAWPRAGDRVELRSGLAEVNAKTFRLAHWLLDPETGRAWASAEAVAVDFDLTRRRIVPLDGAAQARMRAHVKPGLAL